MARLALWLLALNLLLAGCVADYDYIYDEESQDEEELTHVPSFTSVPQNFDVMKGDSITLPCLMDQAGHTIIWKSVLEDGSERVYFMGNIPMTTDDRFKLEQTGDKGSSLVISRLQPGESGAYICQVSSNPPVSLRHTVNVRYPPMVKATPEDGVLVARQGTTASMACTASGNPTPTVTWTKKGGLLPGGKKKMEGAKVAIDKVERAHMGTYMCTVDNGVGDAVVKTFRLEINSPPEIEAVTKVHTGAGYEAQLICTVHGQPLPTVSWARMGDKTVDKMRHVQQHEGAQYSLTIDEVRDSDLGQYVCRARNDYGTANAAIELTGQPKEVLMTSPAHGREKDSYTLRWNVESYAPIEEYKVTYKIAQTNNSSPKQQWEQITVPAPAKEGSTVVYSHLHELRNLAPATAYEAVVTAKNKYGWSEEPSRPFKLYTLGAHFTAADLVGGEALGSTDPNSAVSTRSGALTAATALLCALLAVL
ncbi:Down syndrome cell adhesion molecule-like protein Dscam2 isoform X1 [Amphibalanus amphitrite]|uniref:Down syndrome cell adhesion molecule-like protein Dscam2 isoform X1 n=1 Tax=Amphibalanus amphitrite TaxID=1232801 RepID=UPI001C9245E7|nr:Down syndrome cell adhesion molecule-like protein Dscam2 isoform X1 [Amphibalanus amphitrite]